MKRPTLEHTLTQNVPQTLPAEGTAQPEKLGAVATPTHHGELHTANRRLLSGDDAVQEFRRMIFIGTRREAEQLAGDPKEVDAIHFGLFTNSVEILHQIDGFKRLKHSVNLEVFLFDLSTSIQREKLIRRCSQP